MLFLEKTLFSMTEALTASNVDKIAEFLEVYLREEKILAESMALKMRLTVDTVLVQYLEKLPEGSKIELRIYQKLGRKYLRLSVRGEALNPLKQDEMAEFDFAYSVLDSVDVLPQYFYERGSNVILIAFPTQPITPAYLSAGGIVAAIITSAAFKFWGTPELAAKYVEYFIHPSFLAIVGFLGIIGILILFFSLLASFCNMSDSRALEKYGSVFFKLTLGGNILFTIACGAILSVAYDTLDLAGSTLGFASLHTVYTIFLGVIPSNIIDPFLQKDLLQVVFMTFLLGVLIVSMRERCPRIVQLVNELYGLILVIKGRMFISLPLITYFSFTELLLRNMRAELEVFVQLPVTVFLLALMYIIVVISLFQLKSGYSIRYYLKDALPIAVTGFLTSSSLICYAGIDKICAKYGVEDSSLRFALPLMQVLFKPGATILLSTGIIIMLSLYGLNLTLAQFLIFEVTLFLITIACPTTPSGALAMYAILVKQVGLPEDAMSILLSVDVILDMIVTASTVLVIPSIIIIFDCLLKRKSAFSVVTSGA